MPEIRKLGFGSYELLLYGIKPGLEVIKLSNINGLKLFSQCILLFDQVIEPDFAIFRLSPEFIDDIREIFMVLFLSVEFVD
jgi:hypothetical protein